MILKLSRKLIDNEHKLIFKLLEIDLNFLCEIFTIQKYIRIY